MSQGLLLQQATLALQMAHLSPLPVANPGLEGDLTDAGSAALAAALRQQGAQGSHTAHWHTNFLSASLVGDSETRDSPHSIGCIPSTSDGSIGGRGIDRGCMHTACRRVAEQRGERRGLQRAHRAPARHALLLPGRRWRQPRDDRHVLRHRHHRLRARKQHLPSSDLLAMSDRQEPCRTMSFRSHLWALHAQLF